MRFRIFALAVLFAASAHADCAEGLDEFSSCEIEGRDARVSVCFNGETVTYSFGPLAGPPELVLSEPVETVDFEPWSGVGRNISESVTFTNDGYSYQVAGGFRRMFVGEPEDESPRQFGWVEIARDGEPLTKLDCVPETVRYAFGEGLYDLKTQAGLKWDYRERKWVPQSD